MKDPVLTKAADMLAVRIGHVQRILIGAGASDYEVAEALAHLNEVWVVLETGALPDEIKRPPRQIEQRFLDGTCGPRPVGGLRLVARHEDGVRTAADEYMTATDDGQ